MGIDPRVAEATFREACGLPPAPATPTKAETLAERGKRTGRNLSLAYKEPVQDRTRLDAIPV